MPGGYDLLVAGTFWDSVDFDPGSSSDIHDSNGFSDAFVSKLDTFGEYVWARTWGGESLDVANDVVGSPSGNVYITGYYMQTVDFDPGTGEYTAPIYGQYDYYLLKLLPNGYWY